MGVMALQAGTGIANYFGQKGKKASVNLNLPSYQASKYDAPSSEQLFNTLQDRVAGRNVGFSPQDLQTMNDQAIDQSAQAGNDVMNRSMAGRQQTGGISKGGTNVLREKTAMYAGGLRSNAMRDVAINNAVQKRQEINAAIPEEQNFLGAERSQAQTLYGNQMQQAMLQKEEADKVQAYNTARNDYSNQQIGNMVGGFTSGYAGTNPNPFSFGYTGANGTAFNPNMGMGGGNTGMYSIGQMLAGRKPKQQYSTPPEGYDLGFNPFGKVAQ